MFAPFCLDCFSLSLSNSHSQHIPSVLTQLGSIQLCCPRRERGKVCVLKRQERSFIFFSNFLCGYFKPRSIFSPLLFLIFVNLCQVLYYFCVIMLRPVSFGLCTLCQVQISYPVALGINWIKNALFF